MEREDQWNKLKVMNRKHNIPWLLMQDFNTVMQFNEKSGGKRIRQSKLDKVNNFSLESGQ